MSIRVTQVAIKAAIVDRASRQLGTLEQQSGQGYVCLFSSPRRPYAPSSITDIHVNDTVKFSRPGGKISKGTVKYIGPIPDKSDQYLGLELEDEGKPRPRPELHDVRCVPFPESKHDGVYQGQRLFQW